MEDYLKIINDNNAQMWFETDIIDMKKEATNTFTNVYLDDSNMVGLPKRDGSQSRLGPTPLHFQESQVGADSMAGSFNYSTPFLSQIPPLPAVNCSSTDVQLPYLYEPDTSSSNAWDLPLASYFDFSGPNQHAVQPKDYDYPAEGGQYDQQQEGYGQQWYNPVPPMSECLQRELDAFGGSGADTGVAVQDNKTGGPRGKYLAGNTAAAGNGGVPAPHKKKRFFQVVQATPGVGRGLAQFKNLPMMTPSNTRIIKILHSAGSQEKTQQTSKASNRVPPLKIWKDGNTSRYMTTVMSLCGQTKNIYHQVKEAPPQLVSDASKSKGLASKTFAPTSAVMVTTDVAAPPEDVATLPSSPEAGAPRNAILPASLPHAGRSPVVFKNPIYGHKKLKYRCNACAYREATLGSLITHVKAHGFPYCMLCALVLATPKQLAAHVRKTHPSIELPDMVTVTSKYGRKRHVLSSVAFAQNRLYPKRHTRAEKEETPAKKRTGGDSAKARLL